MDAHGMASPEKLPNKPLQQPNGADLIRLK